MAQSEASSARGGPAPPVASLSSGFGALASRTAADSVGGAAPGTEARETAGGASAPRRRRSTTLNPWSGSDSLMQCAPGPGTIAPDLRLAHVVVRDNGRTGGPRARGPFSLVVYWRGPDGETRRWAAPGRREGPRMPTPEAGQLFLELLRVMARLRG